MSEPFKVVVSGSRDWPEQYLWFVTQILIEHCAERDDIDQEILVITGGAEGVDQWADEEAERLHMATKVMRPKYDKYPPHRAPLIRNIEMLEQRPDLLLAFHWGNSPGTAHTIREAYKRGIPFIRFTEESLRPDIAAIDATP